MNKEPFEESKIKGNVAETIIEFLFRELGFYVIRMGKEHTVAPLTQLSYFINKIKGKGTFYLDNKFIDDPHGVIKTLPDFAIVGENGIVHFVEVKFRWNGTIDGDKDPIVFSNFRHTILITVNLEVNSYIKKQVDHDIDDNYFNGLNETRFHVWYDANSVKTGKFDYGKTKEDEIIIEVSTLKDCLKFLFEKGDKEIDAVLKKYEKYVDKYLRKSLEKKIVPKKNMEELTELSAMQHSKYACEKCGGQYEITVPPYQRKNPAYKICRCDD
jgi:hypothetical protein